MLGFLTGSGKPKTTSGPKKVQSINKSLQPIVELQAQPEVSYDVKKLCRAIAEQETHNCRDGGNSVAVNNCHGIGGAGNFRKYATKADSYADCERLWTTNYGKFPDLVLAKRWSGGSGEMWLENVTSYYLTH